MEILTGNELMSGATVYLDPQGKWVEEIDKARVFLPEEAEAKDAAIAAPVFDRQHLDEDGHVSI